MGITYLGPVDGHDLKTLTKTLNEAKRVNHAVLVHVVTKKGKGYLPAETNPSKFHGTGPFDVTTGEAIGRIGEGFLYRYFFQSACRYRKEGQEGCSYY